MTSKVTRLKNAPASIAGPCRTIARKDLHNAISAKNDAAARVQSAEIAARRAQELLRAAETQIAQFHDLDDLLANHGAAAIKSWASKNGSAEPSFDLPPDLSARKDLRDAQKSGLPQHERQMMCLREN
jgi:hypothetical protein